MKKIVEFEIKIDGNCNKCDALEVGYLNGYCHAFKKRVENCYGEYNQCDACKSYISEHQNAEDV